MIRGNRKAAYLRQGIQLPVTMWDYLPVENGDDNSLESDFIETETTDEDGTA